MLSDYLYCSISFSNSAAICGQMSELAWAMELLCGHVICSWLTCVPLAGLSVGFYVHLNTGSLAGQSVGFYIHLNTGSRHLCASKSF